MQCRPARTFAVTPVCGQLVPGGTDAPEGTDHVLAAERARVDLLVALVYICSAKPSNPAAQNKHLLVAMLSFVSLTHVSKTQDKSVSLSTRAKIDTCIPRGPPPLRVTIGVSGTFTCLLGAWQKTLNTRALVPADHVGARSVPAGVPQATFVLV